MPDEETPAPTDDVDVTTREPALPTLELPDYHGRAPVGMKTSLNGAGNRITREHSIDDRIVFVVEAKVKKAGHESTDDGLLYVETLKVVDLFEIQGDPGRRLISAVRQSYRTADDQVKGRDPLKGEDVDLGVAGVTDASGVALTPAELDALRGDPVRAMLDEKVTPVVVLYSDGARELWPDDFGAGAPRPEPGERFVVDDETDVYVEKLLDASTGETVEEWTREQEENRLLELEKALEAREALEDSTADAGPENAEEAFEEDLDSAAEDAFDDPLEEKRRAGLEDPPLPGEEESSNVVDFPGAAAGLAAELNEPNASDFSVVDRDLAGVRDLVAEIGELSRLRRLLEAERRGRGRGLKTRKGALEIIEARISDVEKLEAMDEKPEESF